MQITFS